MSPWRKYVRRPRILDDISFAFGAALIWGVAGAVVALRVGPVRALPDATVATTLALQAGTGFGFGWWGGLLWSFVLALQARTPAPQPRRQLYLATVAATAVFAAVTWGTLAAGLAAKTGVVAGIVAATVVARVWLAATRPRKRP